MKHVPIPFDHLGQTANIWLPFVEGVAKRSRCGVAQHVQEIMSGAVMLHLAWNDETKTAHALAASRIEIRGADRIGVLIWCTGSGRADWLPLLPELERYHREHLGCAGFKAIARPGWTKALKQNGYRLTHVVMEKD